MSIDRKTWLDHTKKISHRLIEDNFSEEESMFNIFWQAFCFKIDDVFKTDLSGQLTLDSKDTVITNISFAKDCSNDLVTPIVVATVAEVMRQINPKNSLSQIENLVSKTAAQFNAAPSLTACLKCSLPKLCIEVLACDLNAKQAIVSESVQSKYEIWVNRTSLIVDSINFYKKKKNKYLFWIDLGIDRNYSHIVEGKHIGQTASNLLRFLVESLGNRIAVSDILAQVFNDESKKVTDERKNKIERQISNLHSYSNGNFRKYLLDQKFTKGIGLKEGFEDKYFLYQQLIPANHD